MGQSLPSSLLFRCHLPKLESLPYRICWSQPGLSSLPSAQREVRSQVLPHLRSQDHCCSVTPVPLAGEFYLLLKAASGPIVCADPTHFVLCQVEFSLPCKKRSSSMTACFYWAVPTSQVSFKPLDPYRESWGLLQLPIHNCQHRSRLDGSRKSEPTGSVSALAPQTISESSCNIRDSKWGKAWGVGLGLLSGELEALESSGDNKIKGHMLRTTKLCFRLLGLKQVVK